MSAMLGGAKLSPSNVGHSIRRALSPRNAEPVCYNRLIVGKAARCRRLRALVRLTAGAWARRGRQRAARPTRDRALRRANRPDTRHRRQYLSQYPPCQPVQSPSDSMAATRCCRFVLPSVIKMPTPRLPILGIRLDCLLASRGQPFKIRHFVQTLSPRAQGWPARPSSAVPAAVRGWMKYACCWAMRASHDPALQEPGRS